MRFKARLNGDAEVIRLLARFPQRIGRTMASLVKQEARALAIELARTTRPPGFPCGRRRRAREPWHGTTGRSGAAARLRSSPAAARWKSTPPASSAGWALPRASGSVRPVPSGDACGGLSSGSCATVRHRARRRLRTGDRRSVTLVSRLDDMDDVTTASGIRMALDAAAGRSAALHWRPPCVPSSSARSRGA